MDSASIQFLRSQVQQKLQKLTLPSCEHPRSESSLKNSNDNDNNGALLYPSLHPSVIPHVDPRQEVQQLFQQYERFQRFEQFVKMAHFDNQPLHNSDKRQRIVTGGRIVQEQNLLRQNVYHQTNPAAFNSPPYPFPQRGLPQSGQQYGHAPAYSNQQNFIRNHMAAASQQQAPQVYPMTVNSRSHTPQTRISMAANPRQNARPQSGQQYGHVPTYSNQRDFVSSSMAANPQPHAPQVYPMAANPQPHAPQLYPRAANPQEQPMASVSPSPQPHQIQGPFIYDVSPNSSRNA